MRPRAARHRLSRPGGPRTATASHRGLGGSAGRPRGDPGRPIGSMLKPRTPSLLRASRSKPLGDPGCGLGMAGCHARGQTAFCPPRLLFPTPGPPAVLPGPPLLLLFHIFILRQILHLLSSEMRAHGPLRRAAQPSAGAPTDSRGCRSFFTTRLLGSLRKPSAPHHDKNQNDILWLVV